MGKRKYKLSAISRQKTAFLALPELLVLDNGGDAESFHAVHQHYFKKEKCICPACGSDKTRSSKVIQRRLKDIILQEDGSFDIVTIIFNQRYLRCDGCKDSVFPEEITFADKGCKYTNRLSEVLADGTLKQSYNKVCKHYGVPASTASVGDIMRRRIKFRESQLPPIESPSVLSVIEVPFSTTVYPVILAVRGDGVFFIDILPDTSEETYISFFRKLEGQHIEAIHIDPGESLRAATDICFPEIVPTITSECIERFARNALLEVIKKDGKRFPITRKNDKLLIFEGHLQDSITKKRIGDGFRSRPRLKTAYERYQQLLHILNHEWTYEELVAWLATMPNELVEFCDLRDLVELHESEMRAYLGIDAPPAGYVTAISGICKSIGEMPNCIFDVLRARCMLTIHHDLKEENGNVTRLGIEANRFTENLNLIATSIRKTKDPYSE